MHPLILAMQQEQPLQLIGVLNAYSALMAESAGFKALYISGAGIANISHGIPDIGLLSVDDLLRDLKPIAKVTSLPIVIDIDTGWEGGKKLLQAIPLLEEAGAHAVQIEDQLLKDKKCGHLKNKKLVSIKKMAKKIETIQIKQKKLKIIARSDAYESEGLQGVIQRGIAYKQAGADIFFPEALPDARSFLECAEQVGLPILANLTEFGQTPLMDLKELKKAKVSIALYPLTLSRAMQQAAWKALVHLRKKGTQKQILNTFQTRKELYHFLKYIP